jgi:hypothetical protein
VSNGRSPLPDNGIDGPTRIDDGTLTRAESPNPTPIGMDARGGGRGTVSVADQIVAYARQRLGQRVGNGECFTLADRALRNAGARSASDHGDVSPDADYIWGSSVNLSDLRPGDVVQFRGYRYDRTVDVNHSDGSGSTETHSEERPHHTAIVQRVNGSVVTVLEQNAPAGSAVVTTTLYFGSSQTTAGDTTTRVAVSGSWWFYRPQTP